MTADRLTFSVERETGALIREAAERAGISVSAWLATAAEDRLRNQLLGDALDAWQRENGAFTAEELEAADRLLDGRAARQDADAHAA
jgi:uncharacterized protein (DUF1778 family)